MSAGKHHYLRRCFLSSSTTTTTTVRSRRRKRHRMEEIPSLKDFRQSFEVRQLVRQFWRWTRSCPDLRPHLRQELLRDDATLREARQRLKQVQSMLSTLEASTVVPAENSSWPWQRQKTNLLPARKPPGIPKR